MGTYQFSNENIVQAVDQVGKALVSYDVERREALRLKLTFEEVLLEYRNRFGEDASFQVRCINRFSTIRVEMIVAGVPFDPLDRDREEADVMQSLLAGIGLAPSWNYKKGRNRIVFTTKKKPLSGTIKLLGAVGLALISGMILNLLPDGIRMGVNAYLLTPVTDAFMGLLSAVSGPLIFLSVLGSICSMGNVETLEKIGSKTISVILLYMTAIGIFMTVVGSLFFPVELGGSISSSFTQVLELIYDIVPNNLFEPLLTGNTLQMIFIAVMVGLAMLVLSGRVSGVFEMVEQLSAIVQTIMAAFSSMVPLLIYCLFTGMISNGNLGTILSSWKALAVILFLMMLYYIINLIRVAVLQKMSPILLWKKTMATFMISFTTASSAAAFTTNIKDATQKLGMDKKLVDFATPLGQVLFMPGYLAMLFGTEVYLAQVCNIPVTVPWLFVGLITNLLVAFAVPPIPGGAVIGFTVVFTQLGIPLEMMALAVAINALPDFPSTAVHVSGWQLTLIDVADSLQMLDKEVLRRNDG